MIWRFIVNALAVAAATWLVPGITFVGQHSYQDQAITLAIVAVVIGLLNTFIKPILTVLSSCLLIITFGLFAWVINAGLLVGASWICYQFGVGWTVLDWTSAFIGSLIISFIAILLGRNGDTV